VKDSCSCPTLPNSLSLMHMHTHTHTHTQSKPQDSVEVFSKHTKKCWEQSIVVPVTSGAAPCPLNYYLASKCILRVKAETFAWQAKRRCPFLRPFLAARRGALFQQASVWCGQGNASPPFERSCEDTQGTAAWVAGHPLKEANLID
jgi:hypothetical protein